MTIFIVIIYTRATSCPEGLDTFGFRLSAQTIQTHILEYCEVMKKQDHQMQNSPTISIQQALDEEQRYFELAVNPKTSTPVFWDRIADYVKFLNSNEVISNFLKCLNRDMAALPRHSVSATELRGRIILGFFQMLILGQYTPVLQETLSDEDRILFRKAISGEMSPEELNITGEKEIQMWTAFQYVLPMWKEQLRDLHEALVISLDELKQSGIVPVFRVFNPDTGTLHIKSKKLETKVGTKKYLLLKAIFENDPFEYHYFDELDDITVIYHPESKAAFTSNCKHVNEDAAELGIQQLIEYQIRDGSMMARINISLKN